MKRRSGQGRRKVKARLAFTITAILFIALEAVGVRAAAAQAEESCLSAPNAQSPPGSRWYYRIDHATQRKCWYMREQGLEAATTSTTATPKALPDHPSARQPQRDATDQTELRDSLVHSGASIGGVPAASDAFAWPVQPSTTPTDKMVLPAPLASDHASTLVTHDASSSADMATRGLQGNTTEDVTQIIKTEHTSTATPDQDTENDLLRAPSLQRAIGQARVAGTGGEARDRPTPPEGEIRTARATGSDKEMLICTLIWLAIGLMLAGIFVPLMRKVWLMSADEEGHAYQAQQIRKEPSIQNRRTAVAPG